MGSSASVIDDSSAITQQEQSLYTKSGKQCCWQDAEEYAFRLRQLEIINHAISVLSAETWKDPKMINFKQLQESAMTYIDVNGRPADNHDWSLLAEDSSLSSIELEKNRFKQFEDYFMDNAGASPTENLQQFNTFLTLFIRLRDGIMKIMAKGCQ